MVCDGIHDCFPDKHHIKQTWILNFGGHVKEVFEAHLVKEYSPY